MYTDIKFRKIKNKVIILLLLLGIISHSYFFINGQEALINIFTLFSFSFSLPFLLYFFNFLASGDAKLLWTVSFAIPISFYTLPFPGKNLFVNIFVPLFIFIFVVTLIKSTNKSKILAFKRIFNLKSFYQLSLKYFSLSGIILIIMSLLSIEHMIVGILLRIILVSILDKIKLKHDFIKYLPFLILTFMSISGNFLNYISISILSLIIFIPIRLFVKEFSEDSLTNEIKVSELTENSIIMDGLIYDNKKNKYCKKRMNCFYWFSPITVLFLKNYFIIEPSSSSTEDIIYLKKLYKQGKLDFDKVRIHQVIPLSPAIFFGFLLTIFFGNIIVFIINLITV